MSPGGEGISTSRCQRLGCSLLDFQRDRTHFRVISEEGKKASVLRWLQSIWQLSQSKAPTYDPAEVAEVALRISVRQVKQTERCEPKVN